jgi:hypothetical protein
MHCAFIGDKLLARVSGRNHICWPLCCFAAQCRGATGCRCPLCGRAGSGPEKSAWCYALWHALRTGHSAPKGGRKKQ